MRSLQILFAIFLSFSPRFHSQSWVGQASSPLLRFRQLPYERDALTWVTGLKMHIYMFSAACREVGYFEGFQFIVCWKKLPISFSCCTLFDLYLLVRDAVLIAVHEQVRKCELHSTKSHELSKACQNNRVGVLVVWFTSKRQRMTAGSIPPSLSIRDQFLDLLELLLNCLESYLCRLLQYKALRKGCALVRRIIWMIDVPVHPNLIIWLENPFWADDWKSYHAALSGPGHVQILVTSNRFFQIMVKVRLSHSVPFCFQ